MSMATVEPFSWDREEARAGAFDGKFLIGVMTTGIYCLPSCTARAPRPQNVRMFATEGGALAAGLRACKRCRPDLFYRGEDEDIALFAGLARRVRAAPGDYRNTGALAKAAGVSGTKLGDLFRAHAQATPAAWLRREHVRAAQDLLLASDEKVVDVGFACGFESESVFHRQFLAIARMTPGAYRARNGAPSQKGSGDRRVIEGTRFGLMETKFGAAAAWVDRAGRLVRFHLRPRNPVKGDPYAERDDRAIAQVKAQIAEYCAGRRREFDLELAAEGTRFQLLVWHALVDIAFGKTESYGALAKRIGHPGGARAVGLANGANPIALVVPCHRVIGADGRLTGYAGGLALKRALLKHEADVAGYRLDLFD
jgi:O-6-methylguanine DNA methyltransferase